MTSDVQKSNEIQANKEKRDMFAAAALTGLTSALWTTGKSQDEQKQLADLIVSTSYRLANAMVEKRNTN